MDQRVWEKIVKLHPEANFLHSWNWGQFHASLGHSVYQILLPQNGLLLAIVEKAKRATYLTIPGGPIINWQDKRVINEFKTQAMKIAQKNSCSFIRCRPQILDTVENRQLFANLGFHPAPMHLHAELTHQLDLSPSLDTIFSNFRKTTRYEIRHGQNIKISHSQNIRSFYELQLQTARRQHFIPFSYEFLNQQFKIFAADNQVKLYIASLNNKILTQAFIIFYNQEADYHYSASSDLNYRYPGSYALLWQAIQDAKKLGMARFNFWGVAPEGQTKHRFYGVSVFKRGFRGQDVAYLPAHDFVLNRPRYLINLFVETTRKFIRGL